MVVIAAAGVAAVVGGLAWWRSRQGGAPAVAVTTTTPTKPKHDDPTAPTTAKKPDPQPIPKSGEPQVEKQPQATAKKPDALAGLIGAGGGAGGLGAGGLAAGAAGATAWIAGNAALGGILTGDALGVAGAFLVGGGFSPVSVGNVGNAGRVLARDVDRVLNGFSFATSQGGAASVVLQVTGYLAGCALALGGVALLPFIGQVVGLVVLVTQAINDADQVRFGPQRYRDELWTSAQRVALESFKAGQSALFAVSLGKVIDDEALTQLRAWAHATAWGFVQETNDARKRAHNARPRGLGQTAAQHEAWAVARGIFSADLSWVLPQLSQAQGEAVSKLGAPERQRAEQTGRLIANMMQAARAVQEPVGALQSLKAHSDYFKAAGIFRGEVLSNGDISLDGARLDVAQTRTQRSMVLVVPPDSTAAARAKEAEDAALIAALNAEGDRMREAERAAAAARQGPIVAAPTGITAAVGGAAPGGGVVRTAQAAVQASTARRQFFTPA